MNKEYMLVNGEIVLSDENGHLKKIESYDILNDILVQENVIEKLNNEIKINTEKKERFKEEKGKALLIAISGGLISLIPLFLNLPGTVTLVFGNTISNAMYCFLSVAIITIFASVLCAIKEYKDRKYIRNIRNALDVVIKYLTKKLNREEAKLNELEEKKNKIICGGSLIKPTVVNDKERIEEITKESLESFLVGYDIKKYYNLYKNGSLEKALSKDNKEDFAPLYNEVIEEEGPRLIKNFKRK